MSRPTIVIDMETVGVEWDDLDDATRHYLAGRASRKLGKDGITDGSAEAIAREGLGLSPGTGRIIAISLYNLDSSQGAILYEGSGGWTDTQPGATRIFRGGEAELLRVFWELIERFGRVITYNGRGFDLPYAYIRSALLGVRPTRHLLGNRYSIAEHCDLAEVMTFFGAAQERFSLDYWCRRFGVASPKEGGLDGSQVGAFYRAGKIDEIAEYCLRDAEATGKLYGRLEHNLIEMYLRKG